MIAIVGGDGKIGRRYQAILRFLNVPFRVVEVGDEISWHPIEKAIIATPTDTHFPIADECRELGIPFLVEKPPTKDFKEAILMSLWGREGTKGFIVNNYSFLQEEPWFPRELKSIEYDYFNSGGDGLRWDVAQLIWIAKMKMCSIRAKTNLPYWHVSFNNEIVKYEEVEDSYIRMIKAFLSNDYGKLWPIQMAHPMLSAICAIDPSDPKSFFHEFEE